MTLSTQKLEALQKKHAKYTAELPFTGGNRAEVKWVKPVAASYKAFDLDDVKAELGAWLPLGWVGERCLVVALEEPHPVAIFDEGFQEVAPTVERFFGEALLPRGKQSMLQLVLAARNKARPVIDAQDFKKGVALLARALRDAPRAPDPTWPQRALARELGPAFVLLGFCHWKLGQNVEARQHYAHGFAWGEYLGAANMLVVDLKTDRLADAIALATKTLERASEIPAAELTSIQARLVAALWLSGDWAGGDAALKRARAHWKRPAEKKALRDSVASWFKDQPKALERLG